MMKMIRQAVLLTVLAAVCAVLTYAFHPGAPALYLRNEPLAQQEVTAERIEAEWSGEVLWIDARPRAEYEEAHIPGALLLNEEEWNDLLWEHQDALFAAEKPIVVYCGARSCKASKKVVERLRESTPLEEVYFLRGGWEATRGVIGNQ